MRQAYSASRFMFRLKNRQQSMKVNRTKLMKEEKNICLYRDIKKEYRCTANLLEQAGESKSITMFSNHEGRPLINEVGFIYDSTVITSYSKIN